jgi:Rhodanese-like domain
MRQAMQRKGTTFLALAAMVLTLGVLWYLHRPIIVKEATLEDVKAEAQSGGYRLITTAELAQRYRQDAGRLSLVDTRQDWEYRTGHIQGAVNFPIEPSAWGRWRSRGPLAKFLGPDRDRPIVFY